MLLHVCHARRFLLPPRFTGGRCLRFRLCACLGLHPLLLLLALLLLLLLLLCLLLLCMSLSLCLCLSLCLGVVLVLALRFVVVVVAMALPRVSRGRVVVRFAVSHVARLFVTTLCVSLGPN